MYRFIDLFAGIGGFRIALENLGCQCVFSSEWNKFSQQTYELNFHHKPAGDITLIPTSEIPDHDILTGGFPCQPFSIAGVSKHNSLGTPHGFEHPTQGTLFFEIVKILKEKRSRAFILENVKNLQSHDKGKTFEVIKKVLAEDLNYHIHYGVIDAHSLVPQNRKRIFIVGFDRPVQFNFPEIPDLKPKIKDILETHPDNKYTLTDHLWNYLQNYALKHKEKGNGFGYGLVDLEGIARTLSARYYKDGAEILIPQAGKNPRRLTPRECARLMGFPESFIIPVSDTQAYRQFGNAVVPPVVEALGREVLKSLGNPAIVQSNILPSSNELFQKR
ncbi:MAG: IS1595 family transposase ISCco3 [Chroococcopsis gigantea SAG 12.99]|nr:DNA (cytosine-5-)-methyltransferase [Chlorogloea purpurea SAG 13.99]MDV3002157.1 IS1595 family transposase ISCco3 [Chroococcopsis gigantea SAG 12.99]